MVRLRLGASSRSAHVNSGEEYSTMPDLTKSGLITVLNHDVALLTFRSSCAAGFKQISVEAAFNISFHLCVILFPLQM